jgi:hypothetical protein
VEPGLVGGGQLAIGELLRQLGEIDLDPRLQVRILVDLGRLHDGAMGSAVRRGGEGPD